MNHATNETACPSCAGIGLVARGERECRECGGTGCADPEAFFKTPRNDYATIAHKVDLSMALSDRPCIGECDLDEPCIRHIRIVDVVARYDSLVARWRRSERVELEAASSVECGPYDFERAR